MAREIRILNLEANQWNKTFQAATSLTEDTSRQQTSRIGKLEETLKEVRSAKIAAEWELKKQEDTAEVAAQTIIGLKQAVEKAEAAEAEARKKAEKAGAAAEGTKIALQSLQDSYKELESRLDTTEARTKMVEDLLAQERDVLKKKLEEGEDALVDAAMFRFWS